MANPDALIVKCRFVFKKTGLYGLMALVFNTENKVLVEDYIYVSRFSELFQHDIKMNWNMFEIILNKIQLQGSYATALTTEFKRGLKERLDPNYGTSSGMITDYGLRNKEKIHGTIEEILTSIQKEKDISLEIAYEMIDFDTVIAERSARSEKESQVLAQQQTETVDESVKVNTNFTVVPATPVLSPVKGLPASDIQPGMKILMKVDLSSPSGNRWIQEFKAFDAEKQVTLPLVATVHQVGAVVNKHRDFIVEYGNNRATRFNIEATIKVKIYDVFSQEKVIHPHLGVQDISSPSSQADAQRLATINMARTIIPWVIFSIITIFAIVIIFFLALSF